MSQLVFLHGPGAGACADAFHYQRRRGALPAHRLPDKVNALIEEFVAALSPR